MGNTFYLCKSECGDWYGIYINGRLEYENHSIPDHIWLDIIRKNNYYVEMKTFEVIDMYMESVGNFPSEFKGIPKGALKNERN